MQKIIHSTTIPAQHQRNFRHLYLDIAGFGLLNGSALAFVGIFAARMGATDWQIGLINAAPALVTLSIALPAGNWIGKRPIRQTVFWASIFYRLFYLLWALLPFLFASENQVGWLVVFIFLMSIPGTILAVSFNDLFASAVPPEFRGQVSGVRNTVLAVVSIGTSLLCGLLLEWFGLPLGYQLVFGLGFVGGMWSSYHLWQIRPLLGEMNDKPAFQTNKDWARPGLMRMGMLNRTSVGLRVFHRREQSWRQMLQLEVLNGRYRRTVSLLFLFHFTQYFAIPIFPLYYIRVLDLSDQILSYGNGFYYVCLFLASSQYGRLSARYDNRRLLGAGIVIMALYPFWIGIAQDVSFFFIANLFGGVGVALMLGAIGNYVLEKIPTDNRPPYLAWYNMALNAAILLGSLSGALAAEAIGLGVALLVSFAGRLISGLLLLRYG